MGSASLWGLTLEHTDSNKAPFSPWRDAQSWFKMGCAALSRGARMLGS